MHTNRGFTLLELLLTLFIGGLSIFFLINLLAYAVQFSLESEKKSYADIYLLYNDLKYSVVLAKTLTVDPDRIEVLRIDDCRISYAFDPNARRIEKTVSCPDPALTAREQKVIVAPVVEFSASLPSSMRLCMRLRKEGEVASHNLCVGGN